MFKELFANLAILVAMLFFYSQLSRKFPLKMNSPIRIKVLNGVFGGILCSVLMYYSINIGPVIVDLRHVPTIMLAFYGGAIPAIISMVITIAGRFLITANLAAYLSILLNVCVTLFAIYIAKKAFSRDTKIILMVTFNNLVFSALIIYLLWSSDFPLFIILPTYWVISYVSAFLSFYVLRYIRATQKQFKEYKTQSRTDGLTGLYNARKFDEVYDKLTHELQTNEQLLSVLYIDIDFFKQVNDTHGHAEGDLVLKEVGKRIVENTRIFDIVSRKGGEEFAVLLLDCPLERAIEIAERIRYKVEKDPVQLTTKQDLHVTISVGVASYQETTMDPDKLVADADKALYKAKQTGRNKVCIAAQLVIYT